MPTRTQQCDITLCAYASHGDTRHPLLFPADPRECFEFAVTAFDLAEHFQTPVFVLSDLDIGMNDWMVPEFEWDDSYQPDHGKVIGPAELDQMEKFYRYLDKDGDGVTARTLPGQDARGAYFVRGSGHNRHGGYTEDSAEYQDVVDRLLVKWETLRNSVPEARLRSADRATTIGVLAYGSSDGAVNEALDRLQEAGLHLDYLRVRAFPFGDEVKAFIDSHETVFVVEQNRDAQLRALLLTELEAPAERLVPVLHYNGMPIPSRAVDEAVREHLAREAAA
jgi:2-oxoglutarate ferredoxin oxidoreductase subunit alpha